MAVVGSVGLDLQQGKIPSQQSKNNDEVRGGLHFNKRVNAENDKQTQR
jgi:hypothetical protein